MFNIQMNQRFQNSLSSDPDLRITVKLTNYLFLTVRIILIYLFILLNSIILLNKDGGGFQLDKPSILWCEWLPDVQWKSGRPSNCCFGCVCGLREIVGSPI